MKKIAAIAALTMLCCMSITAQSKFNINGTIIEKGTNEAVVSATVQLLSLPDSTFVKGIATGTQGEFTLKDIKKAKYTLKVSYIGYITKYVDIDLNTQKTSKVNIGYITLASDAIMLGVAEVTANAAKVAVSGDSLVYTAATYRVPEGSVLEDLVKQLPGAKVDENGNITINGKSVTKILVDGKEFFLNDQSVAMKNIPTEMIDKLKTYERKSDLARVTGIDDGEEETVLDLTVKKGMKNGWFGNINLGGGTQDRYNSRMNINRFNDNTQITLLGNMNNESGRWGWGGLRTNKEIGANIATETEKLEAGGSVRYNYNGSDSRNESSSQNFAAMKGAFSESKSKNLSSNHNIRANFRLEWKPDTLTNIIFRPNVNFSRNRSFGTSSSGSYDTDPNEIADNALEYNDMIAQYSADPTLANPDEIVQRLLDVVVNTNTSRNQSYSTNSNISGNIQINRKLNDKGRNITFRVDGNYSDGQSKQISAANITYNTLGTAQQNNRYYKTPSNNYSLTGRLTYNEPIGDRTYLQFDYRYTYSYNKNDRQAYVYDSQAYADLAQSILDHRYNIKSILKFMDEMGYMMRDTVELSQFSEYKNYNHTIGLQYRKVRDNYNFSIGVDALPQRSVLNYKYMGKEYPEVTRNVFDLAPRINLRIQFDKQSNLRLRYNGRTSQPSMTNLLDIRDDSNPLYISRGNPNLKPSFSNNVNADFDTYDVDHQRSIWGYANFSTTKNSISNKTTYDKDTGVQTTMPMNINGNWNVGGGLGFNTGLGEKKSFDIGFDIGSWFSHNVGFYNNVNRDEEDNTDIKSITKNLSLNGGINSTFRNDWVNIRLHGNIEYSHMKNNVNNNGNQDTYDFNYGADFEWTMPWGGELSTDIGMNSRRGYSSKDMNTNELLWNAQLSQSFLKGNALTIQLEVFDILGQQTNISRTINAFMRNDSRSNAIYQYGMVRAIYRFSIFGGKNTMGTDDEKSANSGWGGGHGGNWNGGGRW